MIFYLKVLVISSYQLFNTFQEESSLSETFKTSRRKLIKSTSALASVSILPSHLLFGKDTPSNQFRFAQVGVGGKGYSDMNNTIKVGGKLVAMCDVDKERGKKGLSENAATAKTYTDYREMLDKHDKDIDGVVVSTPDHTHACVALDAIKRGKHVYVQKPLARTYQECLALQQASTKHNVVTQMGNQGHAGDGLLLWEEMLKQNAFGEINEVHTWSNRPVWPQGMQSVPAPETAPSSLDFDLWLGPVANRKYSSKYLPFAWRGWWDFGCGAMGDMAVHNMDPAFWIFKLGLPDSVKAETSGPVNHAYPAWSIIELKFNKSPVTGKPMTITWYDGKKLPELPAGTHPELTPGGNGCMVVGSKLSALGGSHAGRPRPISITNQAYGPELKETERYWRAEAKKFKGVNHHAQWLEAAKAGDPEAPGSKFDYAAPFTQALLLSCIALRFPGQELKWDQKNERFSNNNEANQFLAFTPRQGFNLSS